MISQIEKNLWPQFNRIAQASPMHPAFLQGDIVLSFGDLRCAALGVATQLRSVGLAPGDRCVIWSGNSIEMAAAILGVIAAGAIPTLVNADAPATHFHNAIALTQAQIAVVDQSRSTNATFDGATLTVDQICTSNQAAADQFLHAEVADTDPASILFTSGSSGLPKGVAQSHRNLLWGARTLGELQSLTHRDRILCPIPWSFDYGWGQFLSTCLLGITQILPDGRGATKTCEAISRHRPTVLPGVPSFFADLIMGLSPIREIDRSSVRLLTNTGSKIPSTLLPEILGLFPGAEFSLNYGLTETYRTTSLPTELCATHPNSVGYAIPGVTISVIDKDGAETAAGEIGEIIHRGAGVFLGYWGDEDRTRETRRDDPLWNGTETPPEPVVYTGDLGWKDEQGLLYIKGRHDRQIKSMGVRVSPDEIENLIEASGLVPEAAVIPRTHKTIGQQVIAIVRADSANGVSTRDLRKMARETMSQYMQPMEWLFVDEFPRTPNRKIDYVALLARYASEAKQ